VLDYALHVAPVGRAGYIDSDDGFIVWCEGSGGEAEIRWLKVKEPGKGAGTRLLRGMLERLRRDPPQSSVYGFTWKGNYSARKFYESRGFIVTEVPGMYRDGSAFCFAQRYDVLCRKNLGENS
jgi:ribosomal protein S18 acetylase RimI-like enzyme